MALPYQFDSIFITLPAAANLAAFSRVKLDTNGAVVAAGVTDYSVGYVDERGAVSGGNCTVRLHGVPAIGIAAGAVEVGDILYAAAAGKVNDIDAGTAKVVGQCLTAAAADGAPTTILKVDYI